MMRAVVVKGRIVTARPFVPFRVIGRSFVPLRVIASPFVSLRVIATRRRRAWQSHKNTITRLLRPHFVRGRNDGVGCHCEAAARQPWQSQKQRDCFASLAMTRRGAMRDCFVASLLAMTQIGCHRKATDFLLSLRGCREAAVAIPKRIQQRDCFAPCNDANKMSLRGWWEGRHVETGLVSARDITATLINQQLIGSL